jgi:feruloyl esterase
MKQSMCKPLFLHVASALMFASPLHVIAQYGPQHDTGTSGELQQGIEAALPEIAKADTSTPTLHPVSSCESLAALALPYTTITLAREETSGSINVAVPPAFTPRVIANLPPFCRVAGVIKPTSQSNIQFEVWMPLLNWNGRFAGTGNGTTAGSIIYEPILSLTDSLAVQLRRGYAVANSDMGHPAGADPAKFAYDFPEQLIDFAYRATHEMTVKGKEITTAFYGVEPRRSYWYGCSTGGRQGLVEATRYPDDYDGIVAGSPTLDHFGALAYNLDTAIRVQKSASYNLPAAKTSLLANAVLAACDSLDGLADGLIDDPRACNYDLKQLLCAPGQDTNTCLSAEQVESANAMYSGLIGPTTGDVVYPGHERGSETLWAPGFTVGPVSPTALAVSWARWVVFRDPSWDWQSFDFRIPADFAQYFATNTVLTALLNPSSNLHPFKEGHSKIIQYHGWADNNPVAPRLSIEYYDEAAALANEGLEEKKPYKQIQKWHRLYMAPGMSHCYNAAAKGPNIFDTMTAIEDWVEKEIAPDRIIASHKTGSIVDRTRPLCPYPAVARWTGIGSIDDAANFECVEPD